MTSAPRPGQAVGPFLAAAPKDAVTTALGGPPLWATVGQGIITEVYWPTVAEPQIRDLGFIVAAPGWWVEVKARLDYEVSAPDPAVPLATIVHHGPPEHPYTLALEAVPDPDRDVLLVRYALTDTDAKVYPLLASHLQRQPGADGGGGGGENCAWIGESGELFASGAGRNLCLTADQGFTKRSVGYFGDSDLWRDFAGHGTMTWTYTDAGPGFVVLAAECAASAGLLALSFAADAATAQRIAEASLSAGVDAAKDGLARSWRQWADATILPEPADDDPATLPNALLHCATVLRVHEDRAFPGAIVASLATPWGDTSNSAGGYHLVWPRDAVEAAFGYLALGRTGDAGRVLDYLVSQQRADGHWLQNFFPDGTPFWSGIQLDETALPVLLAAKLAESGTTLSEAAAAMIPKAVGYLVRNGPLSEQDRWEEDPGGSPFTIGVTVAAMVAGAAYLPAEEQAYVLSLADDWNERIEEWCYVEATWLDRIYGLDGHYVRVGPDPKTGVSRIANTPDSNFAVPSFGVLGLEFLYLPRLGLRDPADQRLLDTVTLVEAMLARNVGTGTAYYRYNYDGYGEQRDGANFTGTGIGRVWPLLTGERGHFGVLRGETGQSQLLAMLAMRSGTGLLPEQVWDEPPLPVRDGVPSLPLYTGCRTLSAMPLIWAHSELIKLAAIRTTGRPIEQVSAVSARYGGAIPEPATSYWRSAVPVPELVPGRALVIEDGQPFTLHYGHDGWTEVAERTSAPLGMSMNGVRFSAADLQGWSSLEFRRRYGESWDAAGDQQVRITTARRSRLRRHSG